MPVDEVVQRLGERTSVERTAQADPDGPVVAAATRGEPMQEPETALRG
jgi:hypothetical protein